MDIGPVEIVFAIGIPLVLWGLVWQEIASVRREVARHRKATEDQTRVLYRMGQSAGWLPPDR